MIARDSVKNRLASEHGISYTEFSYMLLQANDYLWLHDHHDCHLQVGGADQWGNLVSGVDLIRRAAWRPGARALRGRSCSLRTARSSARRPVRGPGSTPARPVPYQLHQHFVNLSDAEVAQQLRMLSLRPLADVEALLSEHTTAPEKRLAQRALADEITELVHGAEAAAAAREAADVLFGGDPLTASEAAIRAIAGEVPTTRLSSEQLVDPVDLLVTTGLASSKSEARRLFDQRGIRANGVQLGANSLVSDVGLLHERFVLLRKGKSTYHVVEISSHGG